MLVSWQHETIRLLPEILSASSHHKMVSTLLSLVETDMAAIRPTLEAFSCFELDEVHGVLTT